jgi:hypothetical protein
MFVLRKSASSGPSPERTEAFYKGAYMLTYFGALRIAYIVCDKYLAK